MIYTKILPIALAIGMTKQEFMKSKPWELKSYGIAYKYKQKQKDSENWMLGIYFKNALEVVVSQALSSFSQKKSNIQYPEKPFLDMEEKEERPLTEVEIEKQREAFVASLMVRKHNFDRTKQDKDSSVS